MKYPEFKVCVICLTFNHSKFIVDAMDGFTMQQTNFPFVCCIVDDASTDGEQKVIKSYLEEHFELAEKNVASQKDTEYASVTFAQHKENRNCFFAVLFLKENHYRTNKNKFSYLEEWRNGCEFEALCEGDDYWISPYKLHKQVEILNSNPAFSSCWTEYIIKGKEEKDVYVTHFKKDYNDELGYSIYSIDEWCHHFFTRTLTSLYRISALNELEMIRSRYQYVCDVHRGYYLLKWGPAAIIHEFMGVYNVHEGGIYSALDAYHRIIHSCNAYLELYHIEHHEVLRKRLLRYIIFDQLFKFKVQNKKERLKVLIKALKLCRSKEDFKMIKRYFKEYFLKFVSDFYR